MYEYAECIDVVCRLRGLTGDLLRAGIDGTATTHRLAGQRRDAEVDEIRRAVCVEQNI